MPPDTLQSQRLILRQWQDSDLAPLAAINADPDVMAYFPKTLTTNESNALASQMRQIITDKGWGFWAVSLKQSGQFIGFVGLHEPSTALPFSPCVEIGWRLHKKYWGQGYATEAAQLALKFAFESLNLSEVVAFTSVLNVPSQKVMSRIGMLNTQQNFDHPALNPNHKLANHVLYKISKAQWYC